MGLMVYGTCVACDLSCLKGAVCCLILKPYRKIYLYFPDNCDCGRKCTAITPLLAYISFYKMYTRRCVINTYMENLLLDFSPQ